MPSLNIAHIRERGVDLIIVPLASRFGSAPTKEKRAAIDVVVNIGARFIVDGFELGVRAAGPEQVPPKLRGSAPLALGPRRVRYPSTCWHGLDVTHQTFGYPCLQASV